MSVASRADGKTHVDKTGFLFKEGAVRKNWQKRWFRLEANVLLYYKDKEQKQLKGCIVLADMEPRVSKRTEKRFMFEIVHTAQARRVYYIHAESVRLCPTANNDGVRVCVQEKDMNEWIQAINLTVQQPLQARKNFERELELANRQLEAKQVTLHSNASRQSVSSRVQKSYEELQRKMEEQRAKFELERLMTPEEKKVRFDRVVQW
mgnify:CR=1 FL=1